MSKIEVLLSKLDDKLNPILIKELRQIVRGKLIWLVMIFFLSIQSIFICFSFHSSILKFTLNSGQRIFTYIFQVILFVTIVVLPIYHALKFSNDRLNKSDELIYITTVSPYEVIKGRFYACMSSVLMIFGLSAPFMSLLLFLPGIDIVDSLISFLFGIVLSGLIITVLLNLVLIFTGNFFSKLVKLFIFQIPIFFIILYYGFFNELSRRNFFNSETRINLFIIAFIISMFIYLLINLASAAISPSGTNQMFGIRLKTMAIWLITFVLAIFMHSDGVFVWGIISSYVLNLFVWIGICESEEYSLKIRNNIPNNTLAKVLLFPFFTGITNAMVWCALMQFLTFFIVDIYCRYCKSTAILSLPFGSVTFIDKDAYFCAALTFLLSCVYGLVSFVARRTSFQRLSPSYTWVWGISSMFIYGCMLSFFSKIMSLKNIDFLFTFSPFHIFDASTSYETEFITLIVTTVLIVFLNASTFIKQICKYFSNKNEQDNISIIKKI